MPAAAPTQEVVAERITVRGLVQGVGFRPFVQRLAERCHLQGRVRNCPAGVTIEVEGCPQAIDRLCHLLQADLPLGALLEGIARTPMGPLGCCDFGIEPSDASGHALARLPRDLATCPECLREVNDKSERRSRYPFTNCTNCGPRYSLLTGMPYDRHATTMTAFSTCADCRAEYESVADRRCHAQPIACGTCGPQVGLLDREGRQLAGTDGALGVSGSLLRQGKILAVKGLGGFQLMCRADDAVAVARLRDRKRRPAKPFAMMVPSLRAAGSHAQLSHDEQRLLEGQANPIVLCNRPIPGTMPEQIACGAPSIGLMLPTTPMHHLLLQETDCPLIVTSGNRGDEPILIDNDEARRCLAGVADCLLVHDRPIARRLDDSVARIIAGKTVIFRLGRGYAPMPLPALEARFHDAPPILATGGHQKAAFALWSGSQAVLTQHIGDLDGPDARSAYEKTSGDLQDLYRFAPAAIACDLHPDYFSTRWAQEHGLPMYRIQHHHAHAAAAMAEHGLFDEEVLALTWDGTGYGTDGTIWGSEILRATLNGFTRVSSLLPFVLPGGESAIRHPNRIAFALLQQIFDRVPLEWAQRLGISPAEASLLDTMIRGGVQTMVTTSLGRIFDAAAALVLGIREVSFEGEAPLRLEAIVDEQETASYDLPVIADSHVDVLRRGDWRPMLTEILADLQREVDRSRIAARFHRAFARWAAQVVCLEEPMDVVLSGGCFQNRALTEMVREEIEAVGKRVHVPGLIPPNDGGLAAGQLAVASTLAR